MTVMKVLLSCLIKYVLKRLTMMGQLMVMDPVMADRQTVLLMAVLQTEEAPMEEVLTVVLKMDHLFR